MTSTPSTDHPSDTSAAAPSALSGDTSAGTPGDTAGEAGLPEVHQIPEIPPVGGRRQPPADAPAGQRCGLVAIIGKPNVGKSTLLNALVGQKISITSRKAQTTRHRITGIRTLGTTQFVFVDTPGFQTRHATALNKSLNKTVLGAVGDVDLILFVVEAGQFNQADARVLSLLGKDIPTLLVANKFDQIHRRGDIAPWLQEMQQRHAFTEFVPMSAKNARDVERLLVLCERFLPEQPWWYAEDELTDRSEKFLASETVREKLFRLTGDELPYTSTVIIDKFSERLVAESKNGCCASPPPLWSSATPTRPW